MDVKVMLLVGALAVAGVTAASTSKAPRRDDEDDRILLSAEFEDDEDGTWGENASA